MRRSLVLDGWKGRGAAMKVHALSHSLSLSDARVVVFSSAVVSRHRVEYEEREFEGFVISATRPLEIHSRRVENAPNDIWIPT